MRLLIDIGNTSLKYTFEQQGQFSKIKRVKNQTVNAQYFAEYWINVEQIIFASVANITISQTIITWAEQDNIAAKQVFTPNEKFGLTVGYKNHQQLGVDRWLGLLGAAKMYPQQNCLIIDLGTATTVDLLRKDGQHLGGWILPGLYTMRQSLLTNTANVEINTEYNRSLLFAKNTSENVVNGCLAATVGAINTAIKQALVLLTELDQIILTGGNAKFIEQSLVHTSEITANSAVIIDELVFEGLIVYL